MRQSYRLAPAPTSGKAGVGKLGFFIVVADIISYRFLVFGAAPSCRFAGWSGAASSRMANKAPQFGQYFGPSAGISPLHWQRQQVNSSISFARYRRAAGSVIMLRL